MMRLIVFLKTIPLCVTVCIVSYIQLNRENIILSYEPNHAMNKKTFECDKKFKRFLFVKKFNIVNQGTILNNFNYNNSSISLLFLI
ncbi:hypothetical protein NT98_4581 [Bacillus cereus]|nr:hypothetical protein NT98_4581 [Bacillus cereus]AJI07695.1 hypothetical protein AQ16_1529 [Bacillus cereus G9241]ARO16909.1 hypothetical protein B2J90_05150 [Bacillus cereus]KDB41360.1 hypothetical protein DH31_10245 [Bacillus cereus]